MIQGLLVIVRCALILGGLGGIVAAFRNGSAEPSTLTPEIWARFHTTLRPLQRAMSGGVGLASVGLICVGIGVPWPSMLLAISPSQGDMLIVVGILCAGLGGAFTLIVGTAMKRYLRRVLPPQEFDDVFG